MSRPLVIRVTAMGALGAFLATVLVSGAPMAATTQTLLPSFVQEVNYSNAPPAAPALFAPEDVTGVALSTDAKVTAWTTTGTSRIEIKRVSEDGSVRTDRIGQLCKSTSGDAITDLSVSGDGSTVVFATTSNSFFCDDATPDFSKKLGNETARDASKVWAARWDGARWVVMLVSVSTEEVAGSGWHPRVSGDGSRIAFITDSVLWSGDHNLSSDVMVRDLATSRTVLVGLGKHGWQAQAAYAQVDISVDGDLVAWQAAYSPDDTQVFPAAPSVNSSIMAAHLDPDANGSIDYDRVDATLVPYPSPPGTAAAPASSLAGFMLAEGRPQVLYSGVFGGQPGYYAYDLVDGALREVPGDFRARAISADDTRATDGVDVFSLDFALGRLNWSTLQGGPRSSDVRAMAVTPDRLITSWGSNSWESPLRGQLAGGTAALTRAPGRPVEWFPAPPQNTLDPDAAKTDMGPVIAILRMAMKKADGTAKVHRGEVPADLEVVDESTLSLDKRTTPADIPALEDMSSKAGRALDALERLDKLDKQLLATAACADEFQQGQACWSARIALATSVQTQAQDAVLAIAAARVPYVGASLAIFDVVNGSCSGLLERISQELGAAAAQSETALLRAEGDQPASWPVVEETISSVYGVERPGCWFFGEYDAAYYKGLVDQAAGHMSPGLSASYALVNMIYEEAIALEASRAVS